MNPVLRKDLLALLRLRRIAAIQISFVLVLAAVVLVAWPQGGLLSISASSQDDLLLGLMLGQLLVLILAVPGVAAVSLTAEREANTFEMLYASRMSAFNIVIGKALSAMALPLFLLLSGLPFTGLLLYRGAVDTSLLLFAYLILVITAILLAVVALTVSSICEQTSTALVTAYVLVLGVSVGVLVPAAILLDTTAGPVGSILHGVRAVSPIAAMLSLLRPSMAGDFDGSTKGNYPSHQIFIIAAAVIVIFCAAVLIFRLRKPPAERQGDHSKQSDKVRKRLGSGNPIMAKEGRTSALRGGTGLFRIFTAMLILSLLLSLMSLSGGAEYADLLRYVFQVIVAFQLIGIAAVTPTLSAPAISGELEAGTFEMLRSSRLTGGQIFWGKFFPSFTTALLPVVAVLPAYGTLCFVNPVYIRHTLSVLPIIVLAMSWCCLLGWTCSVFTSSSARATVVAMIIVASLFALPVVAWWAANIGLIHNDQLIRWLSLPSPLVMALSVVPPSMESGSATTGISGLAQIISLHEWLIGGMCIVMLIISRIRISALLRKG